MIAIGPQGKPHILRWHILPRNRFFNIWLHKIVTDDPSMLLHSHPAWNISIPLKSWYIDVVPYFPDWPGSDIHKYKQIRYFQFRRAAELHRIMLPKYVTPFGWKAIPCWSLFICGNPYNHWGFWKDGKLVGWRYIAVGQRQKV